MTDTCETELTNAPAPRTMNIYVVTAPITVEAADKVEAAGLITTYRRSLENLAIHGARGTRFLNPWGKILDDAEGTDFASVEHQSDQGSIWMANTVTQVFAPSENLARARFQGLRDWLAKVAETRKLDVAYVGSPRLADPSAVELDQVAEEPTEVDDWFYPQHAAWFDLSDQGESTERDVKEAIAYAALDSFVIHTDEEHEAIDSLEQAAYQLRRVEGDMYAWKWVIISLHSALQAFMVLALQGTSPVRVTGSHGKLLKFVELYDRIKKEKWMRMLPVSKPFRPSGTQTGHVNKLSRLRDDFTHFDPKGLSLAVEGYPLMVHDVAGIIRFLLEESGNISWVGNYSRYDKAQAAVQDILAESSRLSHLYADRAKPFMKPGKHHIFRVGGKKPKT